MMLAEHDLNHFFHPHHVAVIGASCRESSVGFKVLRNLIQSEFAGDLFPVNPKYTSVLNHACYPSVKAVPGQIDLAVITTPAVTVPAIIDECAEKGIHSVIIISAGFSETGESGKALEQSIAEKAARYAIRLLGPNCLGMMRPHAHLNATFDNNFALPGHIALVSQSGAICAAILDWAMNKKIGFSTIISMGNSINLDFGDVLDYLALDPLTHSILLYIEGVHDPRRFMNGLRAASRLKPVIAIKAGRQSSGIRAVHSHTGALVGDDDVFSAALSRGGAVRVASIEELFTAAALLANPIHTNGNRLAIVTNGGGAGVMAADRAMDLNVELPPVNDHLMNQLNTILPLPWSHQNPIDILGDATPNRYQQVIKTCLNEANYDGLLAVLVPVAMSQPFKVAQEISALAKQTDKPLLACWMGEKQVKTSWEWFAEHKVPCFRTPEEAVLAFSYLADYHINQQLLLQMPETMPMAANTHIHEAKHIIEAALAEDRKMLSAIESKAILSAFEIPVARAVLARTPDEAAAMAESLGFPVVMKISSPEITHKQDVDGVQLNITDAKAVRTVFHMIIDNVKKHKPDAAILGVTVEHMYKNPHYRELMIGVIHDKVFGPVISVGAGGSLVEVMQDRALGLPPLNSFLAKRMIASTRAMKLLNQFRGKPPVNMNVLINIMLRVSDMVCQLPQIQEMDINPLLIDETGACAVDARIIVDDVPILSSAYAHLTIHPEDNI